MTTLALGSLQFAFFLSHHTEKAQEATWMHAKQDQSNIRNSILFRNVRNQTEIVQEKLLSVSCFKTKVTNPIRQGEKEKEGINKEKGSLLLKDLLGYFLKKEKKKNQNSTQEFKTEKVTG